jgi:hypothetical protein
MGVWPRDWKRHNSSASSTVMAAAGMRGPLPVYDTVPVCGVYSEYGVMDRVNDATAPYLLASLAPCH